MLKTIRTFIDNRHISKVYCINLIVKFFTLGWLFICQYTYTNIWALPGIKLASFFSIMLLPFILLDFPLGKLSDKIGEKKMLLVGFVIIILSVLVIPFIYASILWLWALVLFMTRVGAATIEVMSESYFFKVINKKSAPDEISFFRNTLPVSYVIAPLLAVLILSSIPFFRISFLCFRRSITCMGFFISLRLEDVK